MGWLRLVGSLKLQVTFAKEPYKRDDILQKRPIILRSLLIVATPYQVLDTIYIYIVCCSVLQFVCDSVRHWVQYIYIHCVAV